MVVEIVKVLRVLGLDQRNARAPRSTSLGTCDTNFIRNTTLLIAAFHCKTCHPALHDTTSRFAIATGRIHAFSVTKIFWLRHEFPYQPAKTITHHGQADRDRVSDDRLPLKSL